MRISSFAAVIAAAGTIVLAASEGSDARDAADASPQATDTRNTDNPLDVRVPIPSASRDVHDNGCRVRSTPAETFADIDADLRHVAFDDLISEAIGSVTVRAAIDPPATFVASLSTLDPEMRTLVMLDVLRNSLGRDGLHTFFYMRMGSFAPNIRDALKQAGLQHHYDQFSQAMALFGPKYPLAERARAERYAYSSLDTPMNEFDKRMLQIAAEFGSRDQFGKTIAAYVERTPALFKRIEAERAHLGEVARLRYLNRAILQRAAAWIDDERQLARNLAKLPKEQRTLLAMHVFNAEFENGGVHQFFLNSSGALAPEVHAALVELGLDRQAAIFKRGLDMFGAKYERNTEKRRTRFFDDSDWTDWDKKLSALTDDFYALDGGMTVVQWNDGATVEGGPGIWPAMAVYARNKALLPC
ncbi:DUF4375 domain-containing protein [Hyphomicrobium sp. 1Nfss2.1]|uniref:DMP19 family protein n=1 Tax=Hyphomicrobium sp. 1Nfss2.1 TaxID=3413936 RepID=UPI003C7B8FBD